MHWPEILGISVSIVVILTLLVLECYGYERGCAKFLRCIGFIFCRAPCDDDDDDDDNGLSPPPRYDGEESVDTLPRYRDSADDEDEEEEEEDDEPNWTRIQGRRQRDSSDDEMALMVMEMTGDLADGQVMGDIPRWILIVSGVLEILTDAIKGFALVLCAAVACPIGCTAMSLTWTIRKMKRWGRGRRLGKGQGRRRQQGRETAPSNSDSTAVASGLETTADERQHAIDTPPPQYLHAAFSMASEEAIMLRRHGRPPTYRSQESFPRATTPRDDNDDDDDDDGEEDGESEPPSPPPRYFGMRGRWDPLDSDDE
ncbi:uncharacterized protein IWZ02DRAFT_490471 [Phyllosticta citriasiana]|uniref:uncharacterized protein n=1 Tax=Phyllosticta citriasiana TaxID=595635 RepID=UPI0030FD4B13